MIQQLEDGDPGTLLLLEELNVTGILIDSSQFALREVLHKTESLNRPNEFENVEKGFVGELCSQLTLGDGVGCTM